MLAEIKGSTELAREEPGRLEQKSQFIELRAKGWSYTRIAKKLKVAKSTLSNWSQELEGEIASLRAMELEALYERYYLAKQARLKLLGEQLRKVKAELAGRSLEDISTEKLLEMELKLYQALKEEYVDVRPLTSQEIAALQRQG
jgi:transposase